MSQKDDDLAAAVIALGAIGLGVAGFVTIDHPWSGLQSYRAAFNTGTGLYAATTLNRLIHRLIGAMPDVPQAWGAG